MGDGFVLYACFHNAIESTETTLLEHTPNKFNSVDNKLREAQNRIRAREIKFPGNKCITMSVSYATEK